MSDSASDSGDAKPSFGTALRVWLKIGLLGFGGPAGQIALMHRLLVEDRRWIDERRFLNGLNFCMLLPGPEAQQLATYIGWRLHGLRGGLAAGLLFILPGALVIFALSLLYALYRDLPAIAALLFGIKAAVVALVLEAMVRIAKRALRSQAAALIAIGAFLALFLFDLPFPLIVLAAGLIGACYRPLGAGAKSEPVADQPAPAPSRPLRTLLTGAAIWLLPVAALGWGLGIDHIFTQLGIFFSKMAVVTFGGAYAVLAYVAQAAVEDFAWLQPGEMFDGLGLAETTPGPLILVLQFVGFLAAYREAGGLDPILAGLIGASITLWATFAPCFLWIFLGAPYIERLARIRALAGALAAITAAVVGVIAHLTIWFATHLLFAQDRSVDLPLGAQLRLPIFESIDPIAACLTLGAAIGLLRFKIGLAPLLIGTALAGAAAKFALG